MSLSETLRQTLATWIADDELLGPVPLLLPGWLETAPVPSTIITALPHLGPCLIVYRPAVLYDSGASPNPIVCRVLVTLRCLWMHEARPASPTVSSAAHLAEHLLYLLHGRTGALPGGHALTADRQALLPRSVSDLEPQYVIRFASGGSEKPRLVPAPAPPGAVSVYDLSMSILSEITG